MNRFEGRTIVITGAASGIGAACVKRLLAEGAKVVACDIDGEALGTLVTACGGTSAIATSCLDITDRSAVEAMIGQAIHRFGELHGLINSAGIRGVGGIMDVTVETWRKVLDVNLEGTFNVCQFFARATAGNRIAPAIVNISSTAGIRGVANRIPYAASKFGIVGLTKTMALELGEAGIRVNAITPGMIRTPMTESLFKDPANAARIRSDHPLRREGAPSEIAAAAAFLLSQDASFITGIVLPVDGGKTAGIASR